MEFWSIILPMKSMNFTCSPALEVIRCWALDTHLEIHVVGGWVRDSLLGLPAWDADLTGPHLPQELESLLPEDGSVTLHTRDAGLGTVELHAGGEIFEYTAFRKESYRPGGAHRPTEVTLGATLREDALRRDFSVNAIYWSLADESLQDPTGGIDDLALRRLRTTRAAQDVFNEDGLRLLRLIRQSAELDFAIEPDTLSAAKARIAYLSDIAPERLREELRRILCADTRHPEKEYSRSPVLHALDLMQELSAWDYLCPQAKALCEDPARKQSAASAPAQDTLRLACLWVGLDADTVLACAQRLRFSREEEKQIAFLCAHARKDLSRDKFRLLAAHAGLPYAKVLTQFRSILAASNLSPAQVQEPFWLQEMLEDCCPFDLKQVNISGKDLMALCGGPSPRIGILKNRLFDHCILFPQDNQTDILIRLAQDMMEHETV